MPVLLMLASHRPMADAKKPTKAARAFDAFLSGDNPTKAKITLDTACTVLGVTDPTIIAWRRGDAKPSAILRGAIERWTSGRVKAEDWADAEERAAIRRADAVEPLAIADTLPPGAA